jgi:hypothetical protein
MARLPNCFYDSSGQGKAPTPKPARKRKPKPRYKQTVQEVRDRMATGRGVMRPTTDDFSQAVSDGRFLLEAHDALTYRLLEVAGCPAKSGLDPAEIPDCRWSVHNQQCGKGDQTDAQEQQCWDNWSEARAKRID